jgi:hypothetical protein
MARCYQLNCGTNVDVLCWQFVVSNIIGVPVAELAATAVAPATHRSGRQHRTGVRLCGGDLLDVSYENLRGSFVVSNAVGVPKAKSTSEVVTPTIDGSVRQYGARVLGSRGDLLHRTADVDFSG